MNTGVHRLLLFENRLLFFETILAASRASGARDFFKNLYR
jgi:hypothetical protein